MKMDGSTVQTKYRIIRHPEHGTHPTWHVYEYETLICVCSFLRGAENLVEHLCETDRRIEILKSLQRVNFTVRA